MEKKFEKLSNLVGKQFTVQKVNGYTFKRWDNGERRMLTSDKYVDGFSKKYPIDTDKGTIDFGTGQVGALLEAVFKDGVADLNGKTFEVKSNGKSGMEIRYFFNLVPEFKAEPTVEDIPDDLDEQIGAMPF